MKNCPKCDDSLLLDSTQMLETVFSCGTTVQKNNGEIKPSVTCLDNQINNLERKLSIAVTLKEEYRNKLKEANEKINFFETFHDYLNPNEINILLGPDPSGEQLIAKRINNGVKRILKENTKLKNTIIEKFIND